MSKCLIIFYIVKYYYLDVVETLIKKKIRRTDDFAWVSNLRYYLVKEGDDNIVSFTLMIVKRTFLNGQTPASFFAYFCPFKPKFYRKIVGFSRIRTRIVRVKSGHADHNG